MELLSCFRRFSQIILIITNIIVSILGLCVMILGIWAKVNGNKYVGIMDSSSQFTQVSVMCIVVGLFVMIVGVVGTVGAIFASTIFGRITLGLYAAVLGLLIFCEIVAGITAAVKKNDLESVLVESTNRTFLLQYEDGEDKQIAWDTFQKGFNCCGVLHPSDYQYILPYGSVPDSCCRPDTTGLLCPGSNPNYTSEFIYQEGCATVIIDGFSHNLGAIAGGIIFLGLVQIFGVVLACFVALYKKEDNKYDVV